MKNNTEWYKYINDELLDMYNRYNTSGESIAVHIVRDIVKNIKTQNKWIDIVSMNTKCLDYYDFDFNWIIVELFPRITRPQYKKYVEILPSDDYFTKRNKEATNQIIIE